MTEDQALEQTAKQDIIKHARSLFAQKGFKAVSVREIAKESGQNISMISYYFGSKEGLYKAIISAHMLKVSGEVRTVFDLTLNKEMTETSLRRDIHGLVSVVVEMKFNDPELMKIMQRERVDGLPFARELHEQIITPFAEQLIEVFKTAQRKKIIRSGFDPGLFLGVLFEAVLGFMTSYDCKLQAINGRIEFPRDKEKFVDFLTDLFLQGIMK